VSPASLAAPPAECAAKLDTRFLIRRLLQRGQVTLTALVVRTSFSKDTPQLLQSYSKIGMIVSREYVSADFYPQTRSAQITHILN
jgi:hypothetical protein